MLLLKDSSEGEQLSLDPAFCENAVFMSTCPCVHESDFIFLIYTHVSMIQSVVGLVFRVKYGNCNVTA